MNNGVSMDLISTLIDADKLRAKDRHEEACQLLVQLATEIPTYWYLISSRSYQV